MINSIYLVSRLKQVGPINQALNITSGFNKEEIKPLVVTLFEEIPGNSWYDKYQSKGIEVISLKASKWNLRNAANMLDNIIRERSIQVVHSSGLSADYVNRLLKTPVVKLTTLRSNITDLQETGNIVIRTISQYQFVKNIKNIPTRVACSKSLAHNISNDTGLPCHCIPNGVDIDVYKMVSKDIKIALRQKLGLPTTDKIILSVGIFYARKRMGQIVRTFEQIQAQGVTLVLVGDGEEFDSLREQYGNIPNIIFTGAVASPLEYYQCADLFISASIAEGLPNSVLEALACGLPVVLSDIEPHKECIQHDMSVGLLYRCDDEVELKRACKEILEWDLEAVSKRAAEMAIKHLSKYITAQKYLDLYKILIEK